MHRSALTCLLLGLELCGSVFQNSARAETPSERLTLDTQPLAHFEFGGLAGERIAANEQNWLLRAPQANPGMIEMFRVRDRKPAPQLVPWAGEFVGKYLISAVQALRQSTNAALRTQVAQVVSELIATQAEDGYLGPFPKDARLKGNWDLWGHYHCIEGLLLWHELTGDPAALECARNAADLICHIYLDSGRRVIEAGDPEMNMAIIHGLGILHRLTGEMRYLRMAHEVEKDWEKAGDYLRAGLDGREFFQSPRPRWESLHDLEGLLELWRITGEAKYRAAFEHHWRSIRRWDRRNTGGFSSGEQATGDPYAPTAIETCCTVAWMTLTLDYLKLTGDAAAADDLELSFYNGGLGAQHPSGRWWTYNTPMDGAREASAHTIVFQSRAGTPELNCCSVNGPRVLGMLSEWSVMTASDGLTINYFGPGKFTGKLPSGLAINLECESDYPRSGQVQIKVQPAETTEFNLQLRIPAWAEHAMVTVNGKAVPTLKAGAYLPLNRRWHPGDIIQLNLNLDLRFVSGAREATGKVSLYRGPLLLAYDQAQNPFDEDQIPPVPLSRLRSARVIPPSAIQSSLSKLTAPWLLIELPAADGKSLRLVDFASAGAAGTRYRSWLAAQDCPPPPTVTQAPADGAIIPAGPTLFRWRGSRQKEAPAKSYRIEFSATSGFAKPLATFSSVTTNLFSLNLKEVPGLDADGTYYWRVASLNEQGETLPDGPPARFIVDTSLPAAEIKIPHVVRGPQGEIVRASLRDKPAAEYGELLAAAGATSINGAISLSGDHSLLRFGLPDFPEEDYSMTIRVLIRDLPANRLGQIFSAWAGPMDDPLRVCVEKGKLFARIEAGGGYSTPGVAIETNHWYSISAVKEESRLTLYVDGKNIGSTTAPPLINTQARDGALGGNPHYGGNECLAANFKDFTFYARALTPVEVAAQAR